MDDGTDKMIEAATETPLGDADGSTWRLLIEGPSSVLLREFDTEEEAREHAKTLTIPCTVSLDKVVPVDQWQQDITGIRKQ